MLAETTLVIAGIGIIAIACQWFAWWVKLPAILFLLLAGIVVGPVTGWLEPDALFGGLLFPFVSLSVAVILFEGSLTLKLHEIRGLTHVVRNMLTIGLAVTWIITSLATHLLLGFSWELAFLFGAVTVVTGPTVIVPMLRTIRPNARIANILRWEGIMIDPIGALLAVLVFEFIISSQTGSALGHTLLSFAEIVLTGLALGSAAGYALGLVLRNHWLPEYLRNMATLMLVFGVFALSNTLQHESGLLSITVMGIWLTNMRGVRVDEILNFKESLSVLLISALFIILAARIEFAQIQELGWAALGVLLVMQFVARPLKVMVSAVGSKLSWQERAVLSWIAPRGIVAAAISAVFAIRLQEQGYAEAALIVPLTFLVIIGTVVLQSGSARIVANRLGVAEPDPKGFLVVGANLVARAIAKALEKEGFRTLLADSYWDNIRAARMEGLSTYYGNPISEHADRHLDMVGIGRMLALSPQSELNVLASLRYRAEFGANAVYTLQTSAEKAVAEKHKVAEQHRGYTLFGPEVTYSMLASLLSQGAEIHRTQLTESFDFESYQERYGKGAIPLFALDPKGKLQVFVADGKMNPVAGWVILSLVSKAAQESAQESGGQRVEQEAGSADAVPGAQKA